MAWTRRRVLAVGAWAAGASVAGVFAGAGKRLVLMNLHTAAPLDLEYFRGGAYVPEALAAVAALLRDSRSGEQHAVDPLLLDYLYDVAAGLGVDPVFSVISGFRRERGGGIARPSLHARGRAVDVRLAGVDSARLADSALGLRRGGVGHYRGSDFVHLDTGAFRTWRG
jgi:uncharacterized protein YcbK (DUF882 family)